jgi:hypothetical protein
LDQPLILALQTALAVILLWSMLLSFISRRIDPSRFQEHKLGMYDLLKGLCISDCSINSDDLELERRASATPQSVCRNSAIFLITNNVYVGHLSDSSWDNRAIGAIKKSAEDPSHIVQGMGSGSDK